MPDQIDKNYTIASSFSGVANSTPAKKQKSKRGSLKRFSEFVRESVYENAETEVTFNSEKNFTTDDQVLIKLQDEVFSKGDVLKNKITIETIKDYKNAVAAFLSYFVSHTYEFKKTPERRTSFRHPKSSTIRLINEKLERLANEVFINQSKQLDVLEKVDEIKGLIIDLFQ